MITILYSNIWQKLCHNKFSASGLNFYLFLNTIFKLSFNWKTTNLHKKNVFIIANWKNCNNKIQILNIHKIRFRNWKIVSLCWLNQSIVRRGWKKLRHLFYTKSYFVLLLWFFHPLIVIKWQDLLKVLCDLWVFKHKKQQFSCQNRISNWLVSKF